MMETVTIGQKLDAAVAYLENLDDNRRYLIALLTSVAFSFALLNSGKGVRYLEGVTAKAKAEAVLEKKGVNGNGNGGNDYDSSDGREPRWYIFKILNYALGSTFLASVVHFIAYSENYLMNSAEQGNARLMVLLSLWTVYVLYFWGFFGVSFVDTDEQMEADDCLGDLPSSPKSVDTTNSTG